jgi:RNA polymerase sigma-70 factor (ECF subfamily)
MINQEKYHDLPDEELVTLTLENQNIFSILIERYEEKLKQYVRRITNISEEEIEDVLQEVFIKMYKNLNGFNLDLSFSSWSYRITHNHVISHFRKKNTRPQGISVEELNDTVLENLHTDINIDKDVDRTILKESLLKAISKLDEKYQEVIILNFFEERSYEEISDILQKPIGTVGTLLNRAKGQLKEILLKGTYDA